MIAIVAAMLVNQTADIIAPNAKLEKLGSGYSFTEGPATDKSGNVFFTDQPNDRILRWTAATGRIDEWMRPSGRANGMIFDRKGNLIACADAKNELWSIAPDKTVTVLVRGFGQRLLNGPNDVWVRPDGRMYFTDPMYARPYWDRPKEIQQSGQHVFFLDSDGVVAPVTHDLVQPNGIIGTPDGKFLYVADIGAGRTYRYSIGKGGELNDRILFCELGSDGMTIDNRGNVYLTGKGVTVFNREGKQVAHIDVPADWTANVTFAGRDRNLLFITAGDSVYGLKMSVRGI